MYEYAKIYIYIICFLMYLSPPAEPLIMCVCACVPTNNERINKQYSLVCATPHIRDIGHVHDLLSCAPLSLRCLAVCPCFLVHREVSRQEYLKKRELQKLEELRDSIEDEERMFAVRTLSCAVLATATLCLRVPVGNGSSSNV